MATMADATPTGSRRAARPPGAPSRRAIPNPRDVLDFEEITSTPFSLSRHPIYPDAHSHINTIYANTFLDIEDLFTVVNPPVKTTFVPRPRRHYQGRNTRELHCV